jgi:hypothetical protein
MAVAMGHGDIFVALVQGSFTLRSQPSNIQIFMNLKFWSNKTTPPSSAFEQEVASIQKAFQTVDGLATWVHRLTQEIDALHMILHKKGLLNEAEIRQAVTERMIADHYSGGVSGCRGHSYFPFAQDEATFLKLRYRASENDLKQFNEKVEEVSSALT